MKQDPRKHDCVRCALLERVSFPQTMGCPLQLHKRVVMECRLSSQRSSFCFAHRSVGGQLWFSFGVSCGTMELKVVVRHSVDVIEKGSRNIFSKELTLEVGLEGVERFISVAGSFLGRGW